MKTKYAISAAMVCALIVGCQQAAPKPEAWFTGSFEEAIVTATERDTLIFMDFFSAT